jgi:rod shape-determining protein MreC
VHDKQVRRRRAVLALLVGVSLILLTAYFGESPQSPLHTVQRGIVEVLSPVQEGASKVLTPVRDVAGWFSSTLHAKSQNDRLRKENQQLQAQLAQAKEAQILNAQLSKEVGLDNSLNINAYHAVTAQVISRDPTLWYATVEVDKGSDDGVHLGDPAVGDGALVGKVSTVDPTVSIVTLITDDTYAVSAQVQDSAGDTGLLVPAIGNPNEMLLQDLNQHAAVAGGDQVVTAGFSSGSLQSLYPAGIPIGTVSNPVNQDELLNNGQVQVVPAADLRHVDVVQILTTPHPGNERAQLP